VATENYHVFGLGLGTDDLRYIGWTQRCVDQEIQQILCDLMDSNGAAIANSIGASADRASISLFEIESVPSREEAVTSAMGLCVYLNSLGLDVKCGC